MQVNCSICGNPVIVEDLPQDALGVREAVLTKLAPKVVHSACWDQKRALQAKLDEAKLLEKRNLAWETLCPPLYADTQPERIASQPALKRALGWQFCPKGMLFYGLSGKGKTRAMWLALKQQFFAGKFIVALTHTDFSNKATQLSCQSGQQFDAWVKTLQRCDILFIDDLGKSRFRTADGSSRAAEETLFAVCEYRWTRKLPCMFTCNGTSADFEKRMSDDLAGPFVRRLKEFQEVIHF